MQPSHQHHLWLTSPPGASLWLPWLLGGAPSIDICMALPGQGVLPAALEPRAGCVTATGGSARPTAALPTVPAEPFFVRGSPPLNMPMASPVHLFLQVQRSPSFLNRQGLLEAAPAYPSLLLCLCRLLPGVWPSWLWDLGQCMVMGFRVVYGVPVVAVAAVAPGVSASVI